jgi:hypothetical protein
MSLTTPDAFVDRAGDEAISASHSSQSAASPKPADATKSVATLRWSGHAALTGSVARPDENEEVPGCPPPLPG